MEFSPVSADILDFFILSHFDAFSRLVYIKFGLSISNYP